MDFLRLTGKRGRDSEKSVDHDQLKVLWSLFENDPTIGACTRLIFDHIFMGGISIELRTSTKTDTNGDVNGVDVDVDAAAGASAAAPRQTTQYATDEFKDHIDVYYTRFGRDFLSNIFVQGYCVYTIVPARRNKNLFPFPHVLPRDQIRVFFKTNKYFEREYEVRDLNGTQIKPTPFVHVLTPPTDDGQVVSQVQTIFRLCAFRGMLELNAAVAEELRSKPPVLTRVRTEKAFDERDMSAGAIPGLAPAIEFSNQSVRNRIAVATARAQRDLVSNLNALDKLRQYGYDQGSEGKVDPMSKLPLYATNDSSQEDGPRFIPLPNDTEAVSYSLPQTRNDLIGIQRETIATICSAMGVPPLALSGSMRQITNAEAGLGGNLLGNTVAQNEDMLRKVMLKVLRLVEGAEEAKRKKADGDDGDGDGDKIVPKASSKEQQDIRILFPGLRFAHTMEKLWSQGVISTEAFQQFACEFYHLDTGVFGNIDDNVRLRQQNKKRARNSAVLDDIGL